jgi:hypothetical protein
MNLFQLSSQLVQSIAKSDESPYSIKEVTAKDPRYAGGFYKFWLVSGQDRKGQRIRKKFVSQERAEDYKNHLDLNHWNEGAVMRPVLTKFTQEQLTELDYCLSRLGGRYTLNEAVTFFIDHHRDISEPTRLGAAITAYRTDIENRIRARTTKQKKSVSSVRSGSRPGRARARNFHRIRAPVPKRSSGER